jgi:hypothetical protein
MGVEVILNYTVMSLRNKGIGKNADQQRAVLFHSKDDRMQRFVPRCPYFIDWIPFNHYQ